MYGLDFLPDKDVINDCVGIRCSREEGGSGTMQGISVMSGRRD